MKYQTKGHAKPVPIYRDAWLAEQMATWSPLIDKRVIAEQNIYRVLDGEATTEQIDGILVEVEVIADEDTRVVDLHFADRPPLRLTPDRPWRVVGVRSIHWERYHRHSGAHTGKDQVPGADQPNPRVGSVRQLRPVPVVTADTEEADAGRTAPPPSRDN